MAIRIERLYLSDDNRVSITAYLHEPDVSHNDQTKRRAAVVVFPGGGYRSLSDSEAEPIALKYLAEGFHAFVLRYSVGEHAAYPAPLLDASRALAVIRHYAGMDYG